MLLRPGFSLPFLPIHALNGRVGEDSVVDRALDPNRLLPGEDPKSRDPQDASHWIRVYDELYRFKTDLIAQTRARIARMPVAAQREVKETDLAILLKESERLGSRLEFWKDRRRALEQTLAREG
jgi:hypothetical protein